MENTRMKFCARCEQEKPYEDFSICKNRGDGLQTYCKHCQAKWKKENAHRFKEADWSAQIKRVYGIDSVGYYKILDLQNGRCAICKGLETQNKKYGRLSIDHDHKTGKVRGLLCDACNNLLGRAHDNIDILLSAAEYLKAHAFPST